MIGVQGVGTIQFVPRDIDTFDIVVTDDNGVERTYAPTPKTYNGKVRVFFEYDESQLHLILKVPDREVPISGSDIKGKPFEFSVDDILNLKPLISEIDVSHLSISDVTSAQLMFCTSGTEYMCDGVYIEVYNPYLASWVCISDTQQLFGYSLDKVIHKFDQNNSITFEKNGGTQYTSVLPAIKPHITNDVRLNIKSSPLHISMNSNNVSNIIESDYVKSTKYQNQYQFYPYLTGDTPPTISEGYNVFAYGTGDEIKPLDIANIRADVLSRIKDIDIKVDGQYIAFYQAPSYLDGLFSFNQTRELYDREVEIIYLESDGDLSGFESLPGTTYKISDGNISQSDFNIDDLGDTSNIRYESYDKSYQSFLGFKIPTGDSHLPVSFIKIESSGDIKAFVSNGYVVISGMDYGDKIHMLVKSQV